MGFYTMPPTKIVKIIIQPCSSHHRPQLCGQTMIGDQRPVRWNGETHGIPVKIHIHVMCTYINSFGPIEYIDG